MKKSLIIVVTALTVFILYSLWANKALSARAFEIADKSIPSGFDGFTIVQVSDLHNASFGKSNEKLLGKIKAAKPDIIAVTGDIIDSRRTDIAIALDFIEKALEIGDVYFVTGNHEYRTPQGKKLVDSIKALGATVLENDSISLERNNSSITLYGIDDPYFYGGYMTDEEEYVVAHKLEGLKKSDGFTLLLSHRPEFLDIYSEYGFDLVLAGHAHGGQFRLPFVGGLIAPGQGFFPDYDSGIYEKEDTKMIVSRGLGNSIIPLRLFNRPEIITVILKSE